MHPTQEESHVDTSISSHTRLALALTLLLDRRLLKLGKESQSKILGDGSADASAGRWAGGPLDVLALKLNNLITLYRWKKTSLYHKFCTVFLT